MAGTIFEGSSTPLISWFYAMFLFTKSKNGLSAAELQRQIGVSYGTAFRMLHKIRGLLVSDNEMMSGIIEVDETFVGGKNINRHADKKVENSQGRSFKDKTPVFGAFSRTTGKIYTHVIPDTKAKSIIPIIDSKIEKGSYIMSDEWGAYRNLNKDYQHDIVYHCKGEYTNGNTTTNRVENFWSVFKRTLKGSYISVSRKYLQNYANEVAFRFNNRTNKTMFNTLFNIAATS
jgi:transposase-like protein